MMRIVERVEGRNEEMTREVLQYPEERNNVSRPRWWPVCAEKCSDFFALTPYILSLYLQMGEREIDS